MLRRSPGISHLLASAWYSLSFIGFILSYIIPFESTIYVGANLSPSGWISPWYTSIPIYLNFFNYWASWSTNVKPGIKFEPHFNGAFFMYHWILLTKSNFFGLCFSTICFKKLYKGKHGKKNCPPGNIKRIVGNKWLWFFFYASSKSCLYRNMAISAWESPMTKIWFYWPSFKTSYKSKFNACTGKFGSQYFEVGVTVNGW